MSYITGRKICACSSVGVPPAGLLIFGTIQNRRRDAGATKSASEVLTT